MEMEFALMFAAVRRGTSAHQLNSKLVADSGGMTTTKKTTNRLRSPSSHKLRLVSRLEWRCRPRRTSLLRSVTSQSQATDLVVGRSSPSRNDQIACQTLVLLRCYECDERDERPR